MMSLSNKEKTGWVEITVDIDPVAHEALTAFLFDLGCTGIVLQDFEDHVLKAYLPFDDDLEKIRRRIEGFFRRLAVIFPLNHLPKMSLEIIEDKDWSRSWQHNFRADQVTVNLLIVPAWDPIPRNPPGYVIRMDPGPAFGTGQHPTTRMCLEAIEKATVPVSWSMLDVGTGSGILAIYGAKKGSRRVLGIDVDPEALRWAEHNVELNGGECSLELSSIPIKEIGETFSMVVANLILGEILKIMPLLPELVQYGGRLILSGLLKDQVGEVEAALIKRQFRECQIMYQEEWACVLARKAIPHRRHGRLLW